MVSTCNYGLDKTLPTRMKHLRKFFLNVWYVKSRARQCLVIGKCFYYYHVFQDTEGLKKNIRHRSLDCVSSFDFYSDSTGCFLSMTEENGNRSSLEDFRPINKISHQIGPLYATYFFSYELEAYIDYKISLTIFEMQH